jgi:hypothetical protein
MYSYSVYLFFVKVLSNNGHLLQGLDSRGASNADHVAVPCSSYVRCPARKSIGWALATCHFASKVHAYHRECSMCFMFGFPISPVVYPHRNRASSVVPGCVLCHPAHCHKCPAYKSPVASHCSKPDCSWLRSCAKPDDFWDLDDCKPALQTP